METGGLQPRAPFTLRAARGRSGGFLRRRYFPVLPGLAAAFLMTLFAGAASGQAPNQPHWPNMSGYPPEVGVSGGMDPTAGGPGSDLASLEGGTGMLPMMAADSERLTDAEACRTWTAAAVDSPTVSVARLAIPSKASHEFQKACGDFKDKRFKSAEKHARRAVKIYPAYAAAWVLLGQVLRADHRDDEAIQACRQGRIADPTYAPPYICLAGFAARANDWDEAFSLADRALGLDPATDPYAFLYTALADFHLKRYAQADLYGRSAERLDKWNRIPEVHMLLAKVYAAENEPVKEAKELRKYLKAAPHDSDWRTAKATLAEVEDHAGR